MTKDEALKRALEALEGALSDDQPYIENSKKAITAIKEALAQPEQEPVAFICQGNAYLADDVDEFCTATHTPLYTTPPPCPTCEALARTVMLDQTGRDA